jgi:hypothetical protein
MMVGHLSDARQITVDWLEGCARCRGAGHAAMVFLPLTYPVEHDGVLLYTHWAKCPANGQPIMLQIVPLDPKVAA